MYFLKSNKLVDMIKLILKIGLTLGLINTLIMLGIKFFLSPELMFSGIYMGVSFILSIVILILVGRKYLRTDVHPDLSYGESLMHIFPAAFIGFLITTVCSILLYQNDMEMRATVLELNLKSAEVGYSFGAKMGGADEADVAVGLEDIRQDVIDKAEEQYSFQWSKLHFSMVGGLFTSLIYALIASIFIKRRIGPP